MREIVEQVFKSPRCGAHKVVVISEVDRMADEAADTFLKTLEEPPADTTIFLLTTRFNSVRETIRSRTLHFHIAPGEREPPEPQWAAWLADFDDWVCSLTEGAPRDKRAVALLLFTLYGLAARFDALYAAAAAAQWKSVREGLPEGLEDEELAGMEAGSGKNIRSRRLADIEQRLCAINARRPDAAGVRALHASIAALERASRLMETNATTAAALESAFLRWMRVWCVR